MCKQCKHRTAADGPHDKREMPACAVRSVNTEVKSTSTVSKNVHEFLCSFVYGVRFCTFLGYKRCPKTCQKQASNFKQKKVPKTSPKGPQKETLIPDKPESDEKRKAALFSFHETASSGELCWLLLVVRIPMFSGSFCK